MLDVHPPHHAASTWRDFFIHIATIVVGLLIAIGLEQTVEHFHRRHELQKAREELREDVNVDHRIVTQQLECIRQVEAELKADTAILLAHRANGRQLSAPLQFDWSFRRLRSVAYNVNKQSGALSLMPHPELAHYDYIFTVTDIIMDSAEKWQVELETAKAIATRSPDGNLSPQDTTELITAISDTQGKLNRTERIIAFAQAALDDRQFD